MRIPLLNGFTTMFKNQVLTSIVHCYPSICCRAYVYNENSESCLRHGTVCHDGVDYPAVAPWMLEDNRMEFSQKLSNAKSKQYAIIQKCQNKPKLTLSGLEKIRVLLENSKWMKSSRARVDPENRGLKIGLNKIHILFSSGLF